MKLKIKEKDALNTPEKVTARYSMPENYEYIVDTEHGMLCVDRKEFIDIIIRYESGDEFVRFNGLGQEVFYTIDTCDRGKYLTLSQIMIDSKTKQQKETNELAQKIRKSIIKVLESPTIDNAKAAVELLNEEEALGEKLLAKYNIK